MPLAAVRLVMGDTDVCPFDVGTFGSRSMPDAGEQLRRVAAGARECLVGMAAASGTWRPRPLVAADGAVRQAQGVMSATYGELVRGLRRVEVAPGDAPLTPGPVRASRRAPGTPRLAAPDIVTGARRYGSDLSRPGMLQGRVAARSGRRRDAALGRCRAGHGGAGRDRGAGRLVRRGGRPRPVPCRTRAQGDRGASGSWRPSRPRPGSPSTCAPTPWTRRAGRARSTTKRATSRAPSPRRRSRWPPPTRPRTSPTSPSRRTWRWPSGTAAGSRCGAGRRSPSVCDARSAEALQVPEADVRVIVPDTGGGFGGKHAETIATDAARLSRAAGPPGQGALEPRGGVHARGTSGPPP